MKFFRPSSSLPLTLALSGFFGGCADGPELGTVAGRVSLQGQPIPFAYVVFQPTDPPGTYGAAYTDADGHYELRFTESRDGALVGQHTVSIRTAALDEIEVEDKSTGLMVRPPVPEGYQPGLQVEFEREVKPGDNTHNFDLASK